MADDERVRYEISEGVAVISFDRPEQLNAIDRSMANEIIELLNEADRDPNVRAVVFTGKGRAFCAGADLSAGAEAFAPASIAGSEFERDWGGVLVLRIFDLLKPTIAAINGPAVGIGATLTLPCDVRLGSTSSKIGFVFARRGIVIDGCASWFLPRVVGISSALRWCLSGALISPNEALASGLISSIHEPSKVLSAALDVAREFTSETSSVSVTLNRKLLWHGLTENHPMEAHRLESTLMGFASSSMDAREGVSSFLEKRPAHFSGGIPTDLPANWPLWQEPNFS